VPPGYSNMLLAHVLSDSDCHAGTQLFQSYRRFALQGLGLGARVDPRGARAPLVVTLVSRRPYTKFVEHAFMGRQVANEEQLAAAMTAAAEAAAASAPEHLFPADASAASQRVEVRVVDFAPLDLSEQLELVSRTDVLVGMHGAALTFALYLPPHAAVVELWPKRGDMWRCFEHIATMAGLHYGRWENGNPAAFRADGSGDYTTVDVREFEQVFAPAVAAVLERRRAGAAEVAAVGEAQASR
jgi:hypothetical protein